MRHFFSATIDVIKDRVCISESEAFRRTVCADWPGWAGPRGGIVRAGSD